MQGPVNILEELTILAEKDKFAFDEWYNRGLNPSDPDIIEYMDSRLNLCISELIQAVKNNASPRKLKRVLRKGLSRYRRIDLDTEEAEFIFDYFQLLAGITGIRFNNNLMYWLYGPVIVVMLKISRLIKPERILETKKQPCTKCNADLEMQLLEKRSEVDSVWVIGKCLSCNEYNLVESFPNSRETRYLNFYPEEYLSRDEYTKEQAEVRLEQVKYWRK